MTAQCLNETDRQTDTPAAFQYDTYEELSPFGSTTAPLACSAAVSLQSLLFNTASPSGADTFTGWRNSGVIKSTYDKTSRSVQPLCVPFGKRRSDQFTLRYKCTQQCRHTAHRNTMCTDRLPIERSYRTSVRFQNNGQRSGPLPHRANCRSSAQCTLTAQGQL